MSRAGGPRAPDDQTKLKKQLNELMKLEENKFCADCGCRGPRWASINLGVFICIACSGIHRSLGVHLTFVRSVNLDSWTAEQVQQMQRWGNARAKGYYEANVPRDYRVPTEHSAVREKEMWIRDKYERKRFVGEPPRESDDRGGGRRKKHSSDEEDEEQDERRQRRRDKKERGSGSRHGSRTASREATPTQPAVTKDILSFDVFSAPAPAAPSFVDAPAAAAAPAPKQDEWAAFGGSTNAQSGFKDAFAPQPAAPTDQHVNKMANIMASFGPSTQQQPQQQQQQHQQFPPQQGMPPAPMMGMQMSGMGMMAPRPMGMNMPMSMPMGGQGFMNPMMGQQPNMMMGYPMQNQMFGAPQQNGMMMGGAAPMGFQGQSMGMNPMGMQMNQGGFQPQQQQQQQHQHHHQQQQQQQQPQAGGLNQSFVNFG
ncbi:SPARC- modular calcium-binding protein 2 [Phytophthora pseudosyringae]|uniref:SPARC- modular calcium-binding protein 2 n=1 Tax=Phytophthora pseudosyringae TaxID=221518 RepID=A0A8T1W3X7_9STRA|nr:SPARC- modular calcium-binding protein 2 [Phytophthora pseudosyringae]